MPKQLYIITGASRGLGLAMAQQLLRAGNFLLCISRKENAELASLAKTSGSTIEQWPLNLDHGFEAAAMLTQWLARHGNAGASFQSATLINNAALLPTIAPLSASDPAEIATVLRVGLEAPMQLTAAFLNATQAWQSAKGPGLSRRVLNISSGLGRRPMAAQSIYCATKAGMDHFTRCVALEEALKPNGAAVCSLAPGVIYTDMQTQLRGADASAFPDQSTFINLKSKGMLSTPEAAAGRVLAFLARADFGLQPVA